MAVKSTRSESSNEHEPLVNWELCGIGEEEGDFVYYREAKVSWDPDGSTRYSSRRFKLGDTVFLAVESGKPFVGQILEFYLTKKVEPAEKRITLRWLYYPEDLDGDVDLTKIPAPTVDEMYFSDHVDLNGNPIEVIDGRAFLYETQEQVVARKDGQKPRGYWDGDLFLLVRTFYGSQEPEPRPLCPLDPGELKSIIEGPTTDELYAELGGVRRRQKHISGSAVPQTSTEKRKRLTREEKRANRRKQKDNQQRRRERFAAKKTAAAQSAKGSKRMMSHTTVPTDEPVLMDEPVLANDSVATDHRIQADKAPQKSSSATPHHARLRGEAVHNRSSSAKEALSGMRKAFDSMREAYAMMTLEQQAHYFNNLGPILEACIGQMDTQGIAFDMSDEQKIGLANTVAAKFQMPGSSTAALRRTRQ